LAGAVLCVLLSDASTAASAPEAARPLTPDLSGYWGDFAPVRLPPGMVIGKLAPGTKIGSNIRASGGAAAPPSAESTLPAGLNYTPEALARQQKLAQDNDYDPAYDNGACMPLGIIRQTLGSAGGVGGGPIQIVQQANLVAILYESPPVFRVIPLDGRVHDPDSDPSYMGDSVGHWEGDTLVVDVRNFNDVTWLKDNGLHHSEQMHIVERWRRVGDTLQWQATVTDPLVLTAPWVVSRVFNRAPGKMIIGEDPCVDRNAKYFNGAEGYH